MNSYNRRVVDQFTRWARPFGELPIHAEVGPMARTIAACAPTQATDILDVACGPGGWTREVAFTYPDIKITGVDISQTMIDYANGYVKVEQRKNISFQVMDVTKPLAFPDDSFDLVHARFMAGFLRKEWWPQIIKEFARVTRSGGFIVLTECDTWGSTNSKHFEADKARSLEAIAKAGLSQHPLGWDLGAIPMLAQHLRNAGCRDIRHQPHLVDYSAGSSTYEALFENFRISMILAQPFYKKVLQISQEELDTTYNAIMQDMMQPDFRGLWYFVTAWGVVEDKGIAGKHGQA